MKYARHLTTNPSLVAFVAFKRSDGLGLLFNFEGQHLGETQVQSVIKFGIELEMVKPDEVPQSIRDQAKELAGLLVEDL